MDYAIYRLLKGIYIIWGVVMALALLIGIALIGTGNETVLHFGGYMVLPWIIVTVIAANSR